MTNLQLKYLVWLTVFLWIAACSETPQGPAAAGNSTPASTPGFVFSKASPPADKTERATNWCIARYGDPLVVNAEKINTNRRYFYPGRGILHKLIIGPGGASAILLFRAQSDGSVLLFTSDNFPECLSNAQNYSTVGGTSALRYNNRHNIDFRMDMELENGQTRITIELPPAGTYGMSVNPCLECR